MQIFNISTLQTKMLLLKDTPKQINYFTERPAILSFENGKEMPAGCMGCQNPRCMYFDKSDISCSVVNDFPADNNIEVCPVSAITQNSERGIPHIDTNKCISCGLCISRCPIGAIYYSGKVKIHNEISENQDSVSFTKSNIKKQNEQIESLITLPRTGTYLKESASLLDEIYKKINKINHNNHNMIARNLLIGLGCTSAIRRVGDVYTRMDAVYYSKGGSFGAVEVEFGKETLDASRGILDDIAVLNTRYKIPINQNNALVVCLQLPNARQGYWQVVRDISKVKNIKINTITIGALLILLWNNNTFDPKITSYYLDYENMSLREIIKKQVGRKILLPNKCLGILEPIK